MFIEEQTGFIVLLFREIFPKLKQSVTKTSVDFVFHHNTQY